jgi:hypothetical protein
MTMNMARLDDFFALEFFCDHAWWWLHVSSHAGPERSPTWSSVVRGTYSESKPVPMKFFRDGKAPGLVGTDCSMFIVSPGLWEVLCAEPSCRNATTHPIDIYDKGDEKVVNSDYRWLRTPIGAGPADSSRGLFKLFDRKWREANKTREKAIGLFFDPTTWTGDGVFVLPNRHNALIARKAVVDVINAAGIPGVRIVPVTEVGLETYNTLMHGLRRPDPRRN